MKVRLNFELLNLILDKNILCTGMLVELKLIKRQDLLSLAMGILSSKVQDQVQIRAELSKDCMDTFVFAVCSKKSATKMIKDLPDLVRTNM